MELTYKLKMNCCKMFIDNSKDNSDGFKEI